VRTIVDEPGIEGDLFQILGYACRHLKLEKSVKDSLRANSGPLLLARASRSKATAGLHQATKSASSQGATIKQDIE
jgi:hypothetical protein